jgi:hypothetical protein
MAAAVGVVTLELLTVRPELALTLRLHSLFVQLGVEEAAAAGRYLQRAWMLHPTH